VFLLHNDVIAFTLTFLPSNWRFTHQHWRFTIQNWRFTSQNWRYNPVKLKFFCFKMPFTFKGGVIPRQTDFTPCFGSLLEMLLGTESIPSAAKNLS